MNIIRAKYNDGDAYLEAYQDTFLHGGLFIPTRKRYELASSIVLDVRFDGLRNPVLIRGIVSWRRAGKRRTKLRAGIGVEFLASEARKRDFLLAVARGEVVDMAHRRHRRLPVEIRVDWREKLDRTWRISSLDDIGEGGAFIRSREFLPVGTTVVLEITAPGGESRIPIEGAVAWTCHTPGEEGLGVEFRCRDMGGVRRLRELVRRIERIESGVDLSSAG